MSLPESLSVTPSRNSPDDQLKAVSELLLELSCDHEQTPAGGCFAAALHALGNEARNNGLWPGDPDPERLPSSHRCPLWSDNPNVHALNEALVEMRKERDKLQVELEWFRRRLTDAAHRNGGPL